MAAIYIRRGIVGALMVIACFVLQTSVFSLIDFAGVTPNILLILTVTTAIIRGSGEGLTMGFFCGLLNDIFFGEILGFNALLLLYTGYVCGVFRKIYYPENFVLPLTIISAGDFVYAFFSYVFLFLMRTRLNIAFYMSHVIIPEVIYTLIAALLVYPVLLRVYLWLSDVEQRSAKKFV